MPAGNVNGSLVDKLINTFGGAALQFSYFRSFHWISLVFGRNGIVLLVVSGSPALREKDERKIVMHFIAAQIDLSRVIECPPFFFRFRIATAREIDVFPIVSWRVAISTGHADVLRNAIA